MAGEHVKMIKNDKFKSNRGSDSGIEPNFLDFDDMEK